VLILFPFYESSYYSLFIADFVVFDKIIIEVKCITNLTDDHFSEMINFLKVSNCRLGLIINFARTKLETKRIIY